MYRGFLRIRQLLSPLLLIWVLLAGHEGHGQLRRIDPYWSVGFHTGISGYTGDLSPSNNLLAGTKGFWGLIATRRIANHLSVGGHFTWARIYGSDNQYATINSNNYLRNLHFRNDIAGVGIWGQWEFLNQLGHHSNRQLMRPFIQAGLNIFHHQPKAQSPQSFGSIWTPLQPLQTEGVTYANIQLGIPLELGVHLRLSSKVDISPYLSYNLTFTDYLDDASGKYIDAGEFGNNDIARVMADRSLESSAIETGNTRDINGFSVQNYVGSDGNNYASAHGFPQQAFRGGVVGNDSYWMAGIRVQWIISKNKRLEDLSRLHQISPKNAPTPPSSPFPKKEWVQAQERHIATPVDINTAYSEVVTSFYKDGILFDSDKPDKHNAKGRHRGDLYSIYYAPAADLMKGRLTAPVIFDGEKYQKHNHIHAIQLPKSDSIILVMFEQQGMKKSVSHHSLYYTSPRAEHIWKDAQELPFGSNEYSYSHPTLSPDGKTLYMVSDHPNGLGGTDIYVSHYIKGDWTIPHNIGAPVNTAGNELYPFIHPDGTLYFSSDGHDGIGGLDVFEAYAKEDSFYLVKNLGVPINSKYNDFSLILDFLKRNGFFSSDRIGGDGSNDIYKLKVEKLNKNRKLTDATNQVTEHPITVEGIIVDQFTQRPIPNAYISFKNMISGVLDIHRTDERGIFSLTASNDGIYQISSTALRYQSMDLQPLEDVGQTDSHGNMEVRLEMLPNNVKLRLKGRITLEGSNQALEDANVSLIIEGEESNKKTTLTDTDGEYYFKLQRNLTYTLVIKKRGFLPEKHEFNTSHQLFAETIIVNKQLKREE